MQIFKSTAMLTVRAAGEGGCTARAGHHHHRRLPELWPWCSWHCATPLPVEATYNGGGGQTTSLPKRRRRGEEEIIDLRDTD